jgi:hypothetical protein
MTTTELLHVLEPVYHHKGIILEQKIQVQHPNLGTASSVLEVLQH